ncbi:M6 family metalloprotease domain protein, partial [Vibrio harveyi]
RVIVS